MPYLGPIGLTLVCVAGLLAGAQAAIGFSWLDVAEATGRHLHGFATAVAGMVDRRLESSRSRRTARRTAQSRVSTRRRKLSKEKVRRQTRKTPQIEPLPPEPPRQQPLFDGGPSGELPPMELLDDLRADDARGYSTEALEAISRMLELKLKDFGVDAEVVSVLPGRW